MSPAITLTDSRHREDVISGDDVVLSPTQLSKSIDMLGNGDDSQSAQTSLTSVATFPCCQFHFALHGNSTFPLIFENNPNVDHFKNISIHDLLSALKKCITDEGNINNLKAMLKLETEFSEKYRWIKGNQGMSANDDKWTTSIHTKLNFPVKLEELKSHGIKQFPCTILDFERRFKLESPLPCATLTFPRNRKTAINKFPCCTEIVESYPMENKTKLKELLKEKRFNFESLRESIKSQKATYYHNNGENIFTRGSDNTALANERIGFPLKTKNKCSNENKFPVQQMRSLEPASKEKDFVYSATLGDTASVVQPRLHKESKASNSPGASACFPIKLQRSKNNFPLQDKVQLPKRKFTIQQLNLISKSLQDVILKSHTHKPNELTIKFPFNNKQGHKSLKTFPILSIESKHQIPFKSAKFPIIFQSPKYKFPRDDNAKLIDFKLSDKNIKSRFDSNKITKSLQQTNKQIKKISPETHNKFPLGTRQFYHNRHLHIKFPSNDVSTPTPLNRQSDLQKSVLPIAASFAKLLSGTKFPLKPNQSSRKFPIEQRRKDRIFISSTILEIKQKFQSTKIQKSLQIAPNQYEILNEKTLTKFPLKERMVKKFFRKFPNEKYISPTILNENKICIGHLNFSNFPNNNVNNFTTTTNLDKEVKPPMTPNLYKQHENSAKDFDNEKHASQIHVENPFGKTKATKKTLIPRPVHYKKDKKLSKTHNVVDNALYILPTIEAKNISLTTTKTARGIGQCAENFERHNNNALVNIRDNNNNNGNISLASVGTKRSQNIINSSFNHRNECDIGSGSILRASTPPMRAITSVQNTERHHNTLQVAAGGGSSSSSDLCNPQVAQIVECSSEVRDTFSTTVDNGGVRSRPNSSKTGSILDKNQNESLTTPPHALALTQTSLSTSTSPSSHFTYLNVSNVASPNDRTSFKERKNSSNSSEILPKYSVLELCDSNVINCPDQDRIEIKDITTDQISCQDKENERAVVNSHDTLDDQLVVDLKRNINEKFEICDEYDQQLLDNLLSVQISDFEFDLDDSKEIDEMKIEMKRSKGARPNTAPANGRNAGKLEESAAAASYNRSKSQANNGYSKGPADRVLTGTPQSTAYHSSTLSNDVSSGGRSGSDRLSTTSTNSLSRPSTTVRRLSNDYSSPRLTSSIPPATTAYQRTTSNNPALSSSSLSTANRYNNDSTTTASSAATAKPKYVRRPTSGALLSLDLTSYTPSSEAAASVSRGASLDTTSSTDFLPQRTRLRRQSRFRSQSSQDEDPMERLNRLKAQISASLSEVKGVLQHYSTEEEDKQKQVIPSKGLHSIQPLAKVKEDPVKEQKEQEGPVTFRFVKTIRRRSFFDEDPGVGQKDTEAIEVDRCVTPNELAIDEVDRGVIQKDSSPLKLSQGTAETLKQFVNQEKLATGAADAAKQPSESLSKPVIQIEDSEPQSQDIGPQQKVTNTSEKEVQLISESQSNNRVISNVPMREHVVDPPKEHIKSEEIQLEQTEKNDSTTVNLDKKVNETKTQTKNVQTPKVKPIKKGSQKPETKTGKPATSKIPQKIEKGNTVNDSKLESKQSESNSVLCAENKETQRVERSSPKNTEDTTEILSKEAIKKSETDKKPNESILLLQETEKDKSPTIQVQELNAKDIKNTKSDQQTLGHIETKEKQDTQELVKVKEDSMAKPTIKENEKLVTTKEDRKTKDLSPKPKLLKQKSPDIVKEDANNKVKAVIESNTGCLSVKNKETQRIERSSPTNTENITEMLSKEAIKKSESAKKQNESILLLQETTKDISPTVKVQQHKVKDIKNTKSDQQTLGHIEIKETRDTQELVKVKQDSMAKPIIKENEKLVTTKENRKTKDLSPKPKLLKQKSTDIVKEDANNKTQQDSLPIQSKDVMESNTGCLSVKNKETRRVERSSPKNTEDTTEMLSKEAIKKSKSDKKQHESILLLQETTKDKSPTVQVHELNAKDITNTKSETKEKKDTQELVKVKEDSMAKPTIKENEKLITTKENRKTKDLSPKPKLQKHKTTDIVKEDEKFKIHQDSLPNKDIIESNTGETKRTKDTSPKPKSLEKKGTEKHVIADFNKVNEEILPNEVLPSLPKTIKPLVKIEGIPVSDLKVAENCQNLPTDSKLSDRKAPVEIMNNFTIKPRDSMRRASLAAVEGSKIEPPVHLATPATIQRRPSDSEAVLKKKLITTKTITSGSIEEVTPKPKIIKAKRSSAVKPSTVATSNDTRQQLAATQVIDNSTENRNDQRIKEAATPPLGANKTIQGDKNKDVTMPNHEMPTQMPSQIPTHLNNTTKSLVGQNNRTQLMINEASMAYPPSPSLLTRKPLELDASSSRATNEKATATTTNLAASKFENSEGGAMLANSKPTVVSSTTASAANGPKETIRSSSQQDLHDLLQQESVVYIKTSQNATNELKTDDNQKGENTHAIQPRNLEVFAKPLNEPSQLKQQQVVKTTDILDNQFNDDIGNVQATNIDIVHSAATTASPSITADKHIPQEQQQKHITPTTTTTKIEEKATTKANDSPQFSISSQETTNKDTTHLIATTQTPSSPIPETETLQGESKGLEASSGIMPELQVIPAPVQTAELSHGPHKKKVIIKKIIRQNSVDKIKKAEEKVETTVESVIPEIVLDKHTEGLDTGKDIPEANELSTEESLQSEAAAAPIKPKKVRKVKKKVIIKRQKRRLSVSGDSFFSHDPTEAESVNAEIETLEKPIAFVSDEEPDEEPENEVVEEIKPLKPCISKKEFEIGDEVLFGERVKRTQIKWRRGRVKERTSCISYLLDIDGIEVSSHVNYLKKYTNRKVNFGGKEYLEIDYEQLAEDEERAERVKQRTFSIWNMV